MEAEGKQEQKMKETTSAHFFRRFSVGFVQHTVGRQSIRFHQVRS
jgi:hypothetical protein